MFGQDAGLICQPTVSVRNTDTKGNPALNGKIIGKHVKVVLEYFSSSSRSHKGTQTRKGLPKNDSAASSSKTTLDARKPVVPQPPVLPQKIEQTTDKSKQNEVSKDREHAKPLAVTKEQTKPTGKLDWSKAKPQPRQDIRSSSSLAKLADKSSGNSDVGLQSMKKPISKVPAVESKVRQHSFF
jgi:DNA polymerase delta subunit 3